jgi:hypothetical protein
MVGLKLWSLLQQNSQNCGHVYSKTARIVVMVTAKQPELWSWLQQTYTRKHSPNTPKILVLTAAISALA